MLSLVMIFSGGVFKQYPSNQFWADLCKFPLVISKHYEAKLCIVSGFHNRPKSDLSRNPQHCYFSLIIFAVLDSTNKYLKNCTV